MIRITATILTLLMAASATAPVSATVVDGDRTDELAATRELRERVRPLLQAISDATGAFDPASIAEPGWAAIRKAASQGIDETMTTFVHECSKDYWAMTYATFGLYYLASKRAIDEDDMERARSELGTAITTTGLSAAAYQRAEQDCGPLAGFDVVSRAASVPSRPALEDDVAAGPLPAMSRLRLIVDRPRIPEEFRLDRLA